MSASINNYRGLRPRKYSKRWWRAHMRGVREYWERYGSSRRRERDRILDSDPFDREAARAFLAEHHASEARLERWEKAFGLLLCLAAFISARSCT